MAQSIPVKANDSIIYHIELVHDFSMLPTFLQQLGYGRTQKICIVTDSNVAPLYARDVQDLLEKEFDTVILHTFEAGEHNKNLETVNTLYQTLIEQHFDRQDLLIALGGGVVGDLTGFTAATYLRGIDFIQVPTTLLSQVDSSIGGKTGVDFMQYKNMVGAFYQPKAVIIDPLVLKTLDARQFSCGAAEIIKMAACFDRELFETIEKNRIEDDPEMFIAGALNIKKDVVQKDERESGLRRALNFGHTLGHGIESNTDLLHGECVSIGMIPMCSAKIQERMKAVLRREGLPVSLSEAAVQGKTILPEESPDDQVRVIAEAVLHDKKAQDGKVVTVQVDDIGSCSFVKMDSQQILKSLREVL